MTELLLLLLCKSANFDFLFNCLQFILYFLMVLTFVIWMLFEMYLLLYNLCHLIFTSWHTEKMLILFFVCLWCISKIFTQHTCHLRSASKCFVKVLYFYVESINLDICCFLSDSHFPLLPRHYVLHNTWMLWCELHCTWCRVVFLRIMCNCACCWTITLTASVKTINVTAEMPFLIVNRVNKVSKKKQNWRTQNMYSTYYQ